MMQVEGVAIPNADLLKGVLVSVLKVNEQDIDDEMSTDTVENWTSLNHLTLVISLEEAFDISFTEEQTVEILSVGAIKSALKEHGIKI